MSEITNNQQPQQLSRLVQVAKGTATTICNLQMEKEHVYTLLLKESFA